MKRRLRHLRHRLADAARLRAARRLLRAAAPPAARLDLALVIPVWNDAAGLARLLAQARDLGQFAQIVVVDDGSDEPVAPAPDLTLLRHDRPLGGGVARNAGLAAVTAAHVLFFDADDLLTAELPDLLADLAEDRTAAGEAAGAGEFDFCLFKHADSRVAAEPRWGQPDWDERFWQAAGLGTGALRAAGPAALPLLAQTANYPWNKIYRTGFLRAQGIGCAATAVHQDIPLHWLGFLAARRVLVSDRICAWHRVESAGARLTNRMGPERLEVFTALAPVARAVAAAADPAWRAALADFGLGLIDWIGARIDPGLRPALAMAERDWLAATGLAWLAEIAGHDPALAARLQERGRA